MTSVPSGVPSVFYDSSVQRIAVTSPSIQNVRIDSKHYTVAPGNICHIRRRRTDVNLNVYFSLKYSYLQILFSTRLNKILIRTDLD